MTNLKKTMEDLKKQGLWFVCADMDGDGDVRPESERPDRSGHRQ